MDAILNFLSSQSAFDFLTLALSIYISFGILSWVIGGVVAELYIAMHRLFKTNLFYISFVLFACSVVISILITSLEESYGLILFGSVLFVTTWAITLPVIRCKQANMKLQALYQHDILSKSELRKSLNSLSLKYFWNLGCVFSNMFIQKKPQATKAVVAKNKVSLEDDDDDDFLFIRRISDENKVFDVIEIDDPF